MSALVKIQIDLGGVEIHMAEDGRILLRKLLSDL